MDPKEYYNIVNETAIYPRDTDNFGIAYAVIGLYDEIFELMDAISINVITTTNEHRHQIVLEFGDVVWYIAAICKELDLDFQSIIDITIKSEINIDSMNDGNLLGMVKKYYRDGKIINKNIIADKLVRLLSSLFINSGVDKGQLPLIMATNYHKLTARKSMDQLNSKNRK